MLSPNTEEKHTKKGKTNKPCFNPSPLLTGAQQDSLVGSGKLQVFIASAA